MDQKIERINWQQRYSVGNEDLDAQHQGLFHVMNRIADIYETKQGDIFPLLQDLVQYAVEHFHAENMVMMKAKFPGYADHVREHDAFADEVIRFINDLKSRDENLTYRMLKFVRDWLLSHTQQTDMVYATYIRRMMDGMMRGQ